MPPLELQVKRGSAASTAIFHGAFGMVPTAALVSPVGALVAEVRVTPLRTLLPCCAVHDHGARCSARRLV